MAKILVLDDEGDACDLIERILSSAHDVKTFTEEQAAMDFAKENPVDLAILDIKLKEMSGVDVLARLKEDNSEIKAIMLTGYPTVETAQQAITLGCFTGKTSRRCVKWHKIHWPERGEGFTSFLRFFIMMRYQRILSHVWPETPFRRRPPVLWIVAH